MESLKQKTVLLVDDEPNILIPLEFLMLQQGFNVLTAQSGAEALALIKQQGPDIVVLDVMMPGMTGFELASQIRQQSEFSEIAIIFLTAKGTSEDRMQGYANGAEMYLTKPFDNDEIVRAVSEMLVYG